MTAVKFCVLVRSVEPARGDDKTAHDRWLDCHGAQLKPDTGGRHAYKRFERVFAVRNNLTGTL